MRLAFIFSFITCMAMAQGDPHDYTPISPTSSSIATYIDYPVDHSTGIPNINIPLFEIDTKLGKIPFSLSYHLGKIKSSELTGPVGLGWTLSPDLGITRSQKGLEDVNGYFNGSVYNPSTDCNFILGLAKGYDDYQPDDFYYSLLSKNGKFLYNKWGGFSTLPYEPLIIKRQSRRSFTITDTNGAIYRFGKYNNSSSDATETSYIPGPSLTGWKVTEIASYDGSEKIEFLYESPKSHKVIAMLNQYKITRRVGNVSGLDTSIKRTFYSNSSSNANYWQYMRLGYPSLDGPPILCNDINPFMNDCVDNNYLIPYDQTVTSGGHDPNEILERMLEGGADEFDPNMVRENSVGELPLKEIRFNNGKVVYQYDQKDRLIKLSLYNKSKSVYSLLKYAKFYYSSLNAGGSNTPFPIGNTYNDMRRYTLDKVEMYDNNNVRINQHDLTYSTRNAYYIPIVQGGYGSDIWGFPYPTNFENATPLFVHTVAVGQGLSRVGLNVKIGHSEFEKYRTQDQPLTTFSPLQKWLPPLLKSITQPTKGIVEFEFEPNRFKKNSTNDILFGGGFRIKKIINREINQYPSKYVSKVYEYGINGSGYGEVNYFPRHSDFMYDEVFRDGSGHDRVVTTINSTPFKNIHFSGGAAVLYPEVKEIVATTDSDRNIVETNGYTKYNYLLAGLGNVHEPYSPLQTEYRDEWKRVFLKKKTVFDKNDVNVLEESYDYHVEEVDAIPTKQGFQRFYNSYFINNQVCGNGNFNSYGLLGYYSNPTSYLSYDIKTGKVLLDKKTTKQNFNGKIASNVTTYNYNNYFLMLSNTERKNSKLETIRTYRYYPFELSNNPANSAMVLKNIISTAVESKTFKNTDLLNQTSTHYKQWSNGILAPDYIEIKKGSEPIYTVVELNLYDNYGNPLVVSKPGSPSTIYLWGHNGSYPIAKIQNATEAQVQSALGGSSLSSYDETDLAVIDNLRTNLPNSMVTTFTYDPLVGMVTARDPRGNVLKYTYDDFQRLQDIREVINGQESFLQEFEYNYKN